MTSTASRRARGAGTAVTVVVGVVMAAQARINGELGRRIDDGLVAALLSFLGGLLLLTLAAAASPQMRAGLGRVRAAVGNRRDTGREPHAPGPYPLRPYQLLGGIFGAFLVSCQGLTVGAVGVAVFTITVVAGQTASSLLVDRAGLGPGGPQAVTAPRILGAVLALAAVVLAMSDRLGTPRALWLVVLPALAGVGIAWQQAVTGQVGTAARTEGHPLAGMLPAALVNFVVGTLALGLVTVVDLAIRGLPDPLPAQPWLYLGGPLGVLFISVAATIVPLTGVLLLGLGTVAGQLIGALLLDLFLPAGSGHLTPATLIGTVTTLLAVIVIAAPGRRRA